MPWIAIDTGLPKHPKMAELPNDAARWGWLLTLLEAKEQRRPGAFASERHYRHVLGRHGRYLSSYVKAGLMERGEDGSLAVHDWQRHQWAGAKAAQRETSNGQSTDNRETSSRQKQDASRAVPVPVLVPVLVENTEGGAGGNPEESDSLDTYHLLTGWRPWGQFSGEKLHAAIGEYGDGIVDAAMRAEAERDGDRDSLLKRTLARLSKEADRRREDAKVRPKPRREVNREMMAEQRRIALELTKGQPA